MCKTDQFKRTVQGSTYRETFSQVLAGMCVQYLSLYVSVWLWWEKIQNGFRFVCSILVFFFQSTLGKEPFQEIIKSPKRAWVSCKRLTTATQELSPKHSSVVEVLQRYLLAPTYVAADSLFSSPLTSHSRCFSFCCHWAFHHRGSESWGCSLGLCLAL